MAKINLYKYAKYLLTRRFYYIAQRSWPVWYLWINREARKVWGTAKPQFSDIEERVFQELRKNGIAFTSMLELFGSDAGEYLSKLNEKVAKLRNEAVNTFEQKERKKHLTYLLGAVPILDLLDPAVALARDARVLRTVGQYIGVAPKLHTLELNITNVTPADTQPFASQRWHRDPEDKRMCKVFLYLSDVDETSGPFMYVLGSQLGGKWRRIFPQEPPAGKYPPDGEVEKRVPIENIKVCAGKAGTVIFCDTSGLHKGGYATKKERIMYTAGYTSLASTSAPKFTYPENFEKEIMGLSSLARFAMQEWH